jgi:hypothetical protein
VLGWVNSEFSSPSIQNRKEVQKISEKDNFFCLFWHLPWVTFCLPFHQGSILEILKPTEMINLDQFGLTVEFSLIFTLLTIDCLDCLSLKYTDNLQMMGAVKGNRSTFQKV